MDTKYIQFLVIASSLIGLKNKIVNSDYQIRIIFSLFFKIVATLLDKRCPVILFFMPFLNFFV